MIDAIAPYIYVAGMFCTVLNVGTTALMLHAAPDGEARPAGLALTAALLTWGATIYLIVDPLPVRWLHALSLSAWVAMSLICLALVTMCHQSAPPAKPPLPRINGEYKFPSQHRRTYRLRTRRP